jgi:opacity protein-like surface antigen
MKTHALGLYLLLCGSASLFGQASPTASRTFDLQLGGGLVLAKSDYEPRWYRGGGFYATLDFTNHFGAEIDFRQADSPVDQSYERTYEVGGRYHRNYNRFEPYVKVLYGRGVYNYIGYIYSSTGTVIAKPVVANLAYNEFVFGGGVDFHVRHNINVRGDYEYQDWYSFKPNGLTPQVITIGVAYHFPGELRSGMHWR